MKKVMALCILVFGLALVPCIKISAGTLDLVESWLQPTELYDYYNNRLNSVQKEICSYLVGCYNSVYLGARGFNATDNTFTDSNVYFATMKMYGSKVINMSSGSAGWSSRFDDVLCQYVSSCIMYSMLQNYNSFQSWYNDLSEDFYIPYTSNCLDSWDNFYNDNSNDGISTFGDVASNWNSGNLYDALYQGGAWSGSTDASNYNSFIINDSPILFTNINNYSDGVQQIVLGFNNVNIVDSVYVNRYDFSKIRFGYSSGGLMGSYSLNRCGVYKRWWENYYSYKSNPCDVTSRAGEINTGYSELHNSVYYAFNITPYVITPNGQLVGFTSDTFVGWYPYINHVYLVDSFSDLSTREEIFDVDGFHLSSDKDYIMKPNETINLQVTNVNYPDVNNYYRYIIINSNVPRDNDRPATDDDFTPNPVVLNIPVDEDYYRTYNPTSPLPSFDIGLFGNAGGQISEFKGLAMPFIQYCRELLDCFTADDSIVPKIIVAVLVIGIASGIVVKLLL